VLIGLLERAGSSETREFAAAAVSAGTNANWLGDYSTARRFSEVGVTAYRGLADRSGLAEALGSLSFGLIEVDPPAALVRNDEALAILQELRDVRGEGRLLLARATALLHLGRIDEARGCVERSIEQANEAGDRFYTLFGAVLLARIHLGTGDIPAAIATYRSTLESSRVMDLGIGVALGLEYFASLAIWGGDVPRAVRLGVVAKRLKAELGGGIDPRIGGGVEPLVVGRSQLTLADFEREEAAGSAMDIDAAIAEALATTPPTAVPALLFGAAAPDQH
jgi:tetratricopeptide (TPR) repeat protein